VAVDLDEKCAIDLDDSICPDRLGAGRRSWFAGPDIEAASVQRTHELIAVDFSFGEKGERVGTHVVDGVKCIPNPAYCKFSLSRAAEHGKARVGSADQRERYALEA